MQVQSILAFLLLLHPTLAFSADSEAYYRNATSLLLSLPGVPSISSDPAWAVLYSKPLVIDDATISPKASRAIKYLSDAAEQGHTLSQWTLVQLSLHGGPVSRNLTHVRVALPELAMTGYPPANALLGFLFNTGYAGIFSKNVAKGQIHLELAAADGDLEAAMTLGYQSLSGINTVKDCMRAQRMYSSVTKVTHRSVAAFVRSRPAQESWLDIVQYFEYHAVRGEILYTFKLGKIYYHQSISPPSNGISQSAGRAGRITKPSAVGWRNGAVRAADYRKARKYFLSTTKLIFSDGKIADPNASEQEKIIVGYACGYLGVMSLLGQGTTKDKQIAMRWFNRGITFGDDESIYQMGRIYAEEGKEEEALHYLQMAGKKGDFSDPLQAIGDIFAERADDIEIDLREEEELSAILQSHALSHSKAGFSLEQRKLKASQALKHKEYLAEREKAARYWEAAVRAGQVNGGDYIPALYSLAHHHSLSDDTCTISTAFHKIVAERTDWDTSEMLWEAAESAWNREDVEGAVGRWWRLAEMGYVDAQTQLAKALDAHPSLFNRIIGSKLTENERTRSVVAREMYTRAAAQDDIESLLKVGDYAYEGIGLATSQDKSSADMPARPDLSLAAEYYEAAAELSMSAMAVWNLGWMYENGFGVKKVSLYHHSNLVHADQMRKDFHLAKRYYDQALTISPGDAYLPVRLSLLRLYLRSFYHSLVKSSKDQSLSINGPPHADRKHTQHLDSQIVHERSYWDLVKSIFRIPPSQKYSAREDGLKLRLNGDHQHSLPNLDDMGDLEDQSDYYENLILLGLAAISIYLFLKRAAIVRRQRLIMLANRDAAPPAANYDPAFNTGNNNVDAGT